MYRKLTKGIQNFIEDKNNAERLYLIALSLYLIYNIWITTMMDQIGLLNVVLKYFPIVLFLFKMIVYDRYELCELIIYVSMIGLGGLIMISSGEKMPLFWFLILIASKGIEFDRILKVAMIVTAIMIVITFISCILGTSINLRYTRLLDDDTRVIRNSFGFFYPTDFAARIFFFLLGVFYLIRNKAKSWVFILGIIPAILVYKFSVAKLDSGCMALMSLLFFGVSAYENFGGEIRQKYAVNKRLPAITWFSMPIMASIMVKLTLLFEEDDLTFIKDFDKLLSHRLNLGYRALKEYGFTWFGQHIEMVGYGGSTKMPDGYNYVDCSYLYCYLKYGFIFISLLIFIYVYACYINRNNKYFIVAVALVALNAMVAHHLAEPGYVLFMLMAMSGSVDAKTNVERQFL